MEGAATRAGLSLPPLAQHIAIARDAAFAFLYPHWVKDWHAAENVKGQVVPGVPSTGDKQ